MADIPIRIWHNPKCSKSRETLKLLHTQNLEPMVIEYLKVPPSIEDIEHVLKLLQLSPRALMRKKEAPYKDLKLDNPELPNKALINAMHEHPILIERPIVIAGNKAALGRPPENILNILP